MGISDLTGTPWHMGRYSREDGDKRRHRSRCIHYSKDRARCSQYLSKCWGAAHCMYYREENPDTVRSKAEEKPTKLDIYLAKEAEKEREREREQKKDNNQNKGNNKEDNRTGFFVGSRVLHKAYGRGTVKEVVKGKAIILFDSGKEKVLNIQVCVEHHMLVRIQT